MDSAGTYSTRPDVRALFGIEDLRDFRVDDEAPPFAVVGHNPDSGLVIDSWFGAFTGEQEFRAVLEYACGLFEKGGYSLWLADLRFLNRGFFHSDDWLAEYVFPKMIAAGLVREAIILPQYRSAPADFDVFGSASPALKKVTDGRVRGFADLKAAQAWLLTGEMPAAPR